MVQFPCLKMDTWIINGIHKRRYFFSFSRLRLLFLSHLSRDSMVSGSKASSSLISIFSLISVFSLISTTLSSREDPRRRRQAERGVVTKPPENPHHHTATTPKPSNSTGSQNPTTSTIHKHKHKQSIIQNKHKQASTNQANGLNNPKDETQQTLNRSEQPNRQADL